MVLSLLCHQARLRTERAVAVLAQVAHEAAQLGRDALAAFRPVPASSVRALAVIQAAEVQAFGRALRAEDVRERDFYRGEADRLFALCDAVRSVL